MKFSVIKSPAGVVIIILCIVLVFAIWQPVIPSGMIIEGMTDYIDVEALSLDKPVCVRFELKGRGGGDYNIIVDSDSAVVKTGAVDSADLIIIMEASDFNTLIFSMADGKADEYLFKRFVVSNKLQFAGDISILQKLFNKQGEANEK